LIGTINLNNRGGVVSCIISNVCETNLTLTKLLLQ